MCRLIAFLLISSIVFAGCKKNNLKNSCKELKEAMQTNDISKAGSAIRDFINSLPSDVNTSGNLQQLVATISGNCSLTAQVFCFDCIYTDPPESEIQITDNSVSPSISKTIDISSISNNRMRFVNMHD